MRTIIGCLSQAYPVLGRHVTAQRLFLLYALYEVLFIYCGHVTFGTGTLFVTDL